jgi:two-component system LytT family sensor kinase
VSKRQLYWIFQIIGWSLYGFIQLFLYSVEFQITLSFFSGQVLQVVFMVGVTHLFRNYIIRNNWIDVKWVALIPRIMIAMVVFSLAHYLFIILISYLSGNLNGIQEFNVLYILASMLQSMGLFGIWSLIYLSFLYFERYNRSLKYEAAIKEIELNNLKSQLNPHFIFNALNSIRALVQEDPLKSKKAITQLSNILRNVLKAQPQETIAFSEELATVKDYLALEAIRYEERIEISYEIDEYSNFFRVPPLMLQTLVENGIKHGVSKLKKGGKLELITQRVAEGLKIQIKNSGKFTEKKKKSGYGLLNTEKRLKLIYGDQASLKIGNVSDHTVLTQIIIPEPL